jgi:hypothetical protein
MAVEFFFVFSLKYRVGLVLAAIDIDLKPVTVLAGSPEKLRHIDFRIEHDFSWRIFGRADKSRSWALSERAGTETDRSKPRQSLCLEQRMVHVLTGSYITIIYMPGGVKI